MYFDKLDLFNRLSLRLLVFDHEVVENEMQFLRLHPIYFGVGVVPSKQVDESLPARHVRLAQLGLKVQGKSR